MSTATFTELLRQPKEVVAQADHGAVRITRRDAKDLVLLRADNLEAQNKGIALASKIMRASLANGGDMVAALKSVFAWTAEFSEDEMEKFAAKMDQLVWSSAELGVYGQLLQTFRSWEGTAEALADGMKPVDESDFLPLNEWLTVSSPE